MWAHDYELGPKFQLVDGVHRNEREVLCPLVMEPWKETSPFHQYPIYFDCCIQVIFSIVAFSIDPADWTTYVPVGFDSMRIYRTVKPDTQLYCHTQIVAGGAHVDSIKGILRLIDAEGVVFAEAVNFTVKRASKEAIMGSGGMKEDAAELWHVKWRAQTLKEPEISAPVSWLLIADEDQAESEGGSTALAAQLADQGHPCVVARRGSNYKCVRTNATSGIAADVELDWLEPSGNDFAK